MNSRGYTLDGISKLYASELGISLKEARKQVKNLYDVIDERARKAGVGPLSEGQKALMIEIVVIAYRSFSKNR